MGHYVYKYVLDDEIIYIGKCDKDLDKRLHAHGRRGDNIKESAWGDINKSEIFYIELANSIMSDVVESELIRKYKPKYNVAKKSEWCGIPFNEPTWKKYVEKPKICPTKKVKIFPLSQISPLLQFAKEILRIKTDCFDNDLQILICEALQGLNITSENELERVDWQVLGYLMKWCVTDYCLMKLTPNINEMKELRNCYEEARNQYKKICRYRLNK